MERRPDKPPKTEEIKTRKPKTAQEALLMGTTINPADEVFTLDPNFRWKEKIKTEVEAKAEIMGGPSNLG